MPFLEEFNVSDPKQGSSVDSNSALGFSKKRKSKLPIIVTVIVAVVALVGAIILVSSLSKDDEIAQEHELRIGILLEPTNLNIRETAGVALDQVLIDNVYQGLVGFQSGTLEVEPVLAETYSVSDDGLTYDFELRTGITFHSGNELSTDDVVTSLTETLGEMATITAPTDSTVSIELAEPNSMLPYLLSGREGIILEAAASNDLSNSANGTGPYMFAQWKQGDSIELVKNPDYWGTPATLDRAIYRYITDGKAAINASLDGDLDVQIAVLPSLSPELEAVDTFDLVKADSTDVFTFAYNSARAPFDNPQVRTAFSQAIDSTALISALNGEGKPLGGPITEIEPGYIDLTAVNAYDPDNARKLLEEAGAQELSVTVTAPNFYDTVVLDIVASQLAEVGVTMIIKQVEFGTWLEDVYTNKDFDLSYVDHAEPFDFANYANPDYYFGYNNSEVQSLFEESLAEVTPEGASAKLQEATKLVADDAPAKWLYNYTPTNAVATYVDGFPNSNTNSRINLEGVTINR